MSTTVTRWTGHPTVSRGTCRTLRATSSGDTSRATFDLTQPEADFLADRFLLARPIQASHVLDQSMTAWLIQSRACDTSSADHAWDFLGDADLPDDLRRVLVHDRDFNLLTRGAAAQYNAHLTDLLVGDARDTDNAQDAHDTLDRWLAEVAGTPGALWDRDADH